jgi:four helix bundle protein
MERQELEARTMTFAVTIKELCVELRQQPIAWNTAGQLLDASTSMAANYRATSRARSRADWNSKIGVVAEEADEAVDWLEFVLASKLAEARRVGPLLSEAKELRAIFAASAATSRRNTRRRKEPPRDQ